MKAWQNGTTLWVFDEPAEIPSVAAGTTIIYVQQEWVDEFKEENEAYASLIQPYNYKLLTVKKTVWADHVNDDLGWDITLTGNYASHFTCPATGKKDTLITIIPNGAEYYEDFVTLSSTQAILNWSDRDTEWTFTMPDEDVTITTATASHNIIKTGDFASNITVPASSYVGEQVNVTSEYTLDTDYTLTAYSGGEPVTINTDNGIYFTMPGGDVTLTAEAISHNVTVTANLQVITDGVPAEPQFINNNMFTVGETNAVLQLEQVFEDQYDTMYTSTYSSSCSDNSVIYTFYGGTMMDPETQVPIYGYITINTVPDHDITFTITNTVTNTEPI